MTVDVISGAEEAEQQTCRDEEPMLIGALPVTALGAKKRDADWLTQDGARALARRIEHYWRERGWVARCEVAAITFVRPGKKQAAPDQPTSVYGIRSDLLNGWPRARIGSAS